MLQNFHRLRFEEIGFSDNFNRPDGVLGANWTNIADLGGTPMIVSNAVQNSGGGSGAAMWNNGTFGSNHFSQAQYVGTQANWSGLIVRATPTNFMLLEHGSGRFQFLTRINGSLQNRGNFNYNLQPNDYVRLEIVGNVYSCYVNNVFIYSTTGAWLSGGRGGIRLYSTQRLDNWSGGSL